MKQYIMGMITGASLIACVFMFMGATDGGSGRYSHYRDSDNSFNIINTATIRTSYAFNDSHTINFYTCFWCSFDSDIKAIQG